MDFKKFKLAVQRQFNMMKGQTLYRANVTKDQLWETYISSFPEGTNPIYKERTEHDCQCCKHFIRSIGDLITIKDGKLVSIWRVNLTDEYQVVADALANLVENSKIENIFLNVEKNVGTDSNFDMTAGKITSWDHFYLQLPSDVVAQGATIAERLGDYRTTKEVLFRGLSEITDDAVDTVLELIGQNSLYRGQEHKFDVTEFKKLKTEFKRAADKDIFCWSKVKTTPGSVARIRGTVIGTLLCDLSSGTDIDDAVRAYEVKNAPANYKRPTAIVTKAMIEQAKKTVSELGLTDSLTRRYAVLEDISINNILFADRSAKTRINDVFDELSAATPKTVKNLDKVEEVTIEQFIKNILPQATSLEVMFENKHTPNLVSLVAPAEPSAKTMFKWDNGFSWSYNGDMADSIKERVKQAGGKVDGDLRCSLSWFNYDDLDLHMVEPGPKSETIYFGSRRSSATGGNLDVDMNAGSGKTRNAVENICYPDRNRMKEGVYILKVNNYSKRESIDVGFTVEVEFDNTVHTFNYTKAVPNGHTIQVAQIRWDRKEGFSIVKSIPSTAVSKNVWGLPTQSFHKVNVLMLSPNYWDDKGVGNKHYFFMLDKCINDGTARGFFNEFLSSELDKHRKVLEVVGSKMKTDKSDDQLSGLGFSSTQRNTLVCRVTGAFSRIVKIVF